MKTFFLITGQVGDKRVFWQNWSGQSQDSRPKWVEDVTFCLYRTADGAKKVVDGKASSHWTTDMGGVTVAQIQVTPATLTY